MNLNKVEELFHELWVTYGESVEIEKKLLITDNSILIDEFFFILLGGFGISYELNKSGLEIVKSKGLLNRELYTDNWCTLAENLIREEFSIKQFEPITKSNEHRKYRFIEGKPTVIASAGNWLYNESNWNLNDLLNKHGMKSREKLCECPGIGMKSASWFLRNVGYNDNYAVFDVHILRFIARIGIDVPNVISERVYIYLEDILRDVCNKIGVSLGKMDYLLWILGRNGYLEYVR